MSSIFFSQWLETNNVVSVTFIKTQWRANLQRTVKTLNLGCISKDKNYSCTQAICIDSTLNLHMFPAVKALLGVRVKRSPLLGSIILRMTYDISR